jgi:hypothetical protein
LGLVKTGSFFDDCLSSGEPHSAIPFSVTSLSSYTFTFVCGG